MTRPPAPVSGGDTRALLAEVLAELLGSDDCTRYYDVPGSAPGYRYADALLPVVERIADERAAEALRRAAEQAGPLLRDAAALRAASGEAGR